MKTSKYFPVVFSFLVLTGCWKDEDSPAPIIPSVNAGITINSTWQYSINIDGITFAGTDNVANSHGGYGWGNFIVPPPDSSDRYFISSIHNPNTHSTIQVSIGKLKYVSELDTIRFKSFFHTGPYAFSSAPSGKGADINWYDADGNRWSTSNGSRDETGSYFHITDIRNVGLANGTNCEIKFRAMFQCKLYDSNGNSKTVTDGVYVGYFRNQD